MKKILIIILICLLIFLFINISEQNTYSKLDSIALENKKDIENYFFNFLTKNSLEMMEYSDSPSLKNTLINWRIMNDFGLTNPKDINHDIVKNMVTEKMKDFKDKSDDMSLYKKYDYLYSYKICLDELGIENNDLITYSIGNINKDVDLILSYIYNSPKKLVMYLDILNKIVSIYENDNIKANIKEKIYDIENIDYEKYSKPERLMITFNLLELFNKIGIEKEGLRAEGKKELLNLIESYKINGNIDINNIVILNKGLKVFPEELQENEKLKEIVEEMKTMLLSKNDFQVFVKTQVYELVANLGLCDDALKEWAMNMPKSTENIYPKPVSLIPTFRNLYLFIRIAELNNMDVTGIENNIENYLKTIVNTYKTRIVNKQELYYVFKLQEYMNNKQIEEILVDSINKHISNIDEIKITEQNLFENYMFFYTLSKRKYKDELKDKFDDYFNNGALKFRGTKEEVFLEMIKLDIESYYYKKNVEKRIKKLDNMVSNYNGDLELMLLEMYLKIHKNLGLKISNEMKISIDKKLSKYRVKNGYFQNPQFKSVSISSTHRGLEIERLLLKLDRSGHND
ncbi:hypothetical protein [Caldisalinibacter kiritimatiensis]|uniref:Uncharacterized protein n=1 Tax=Caldisalinibacter kiritimatiensis TaxID=1304284 RepID=R1CD68_9FIRM|nr:hypothetical protein [Caldisalinibacter kiritimatiensis]EOD00245.1 hypothetical protein L21TH_1719 [Caldisalinibacter kiritimatiensis]